MIFITHILFSVLICLLFRFPITIGLILFSILPDVDYPYSHIGEFFSPVSNWIYKKFGHRSITHSIYWSLLLGLLCFVETKFLTLFIGYTSHVLLDMFTYSGVKLFYPLNISFTLFEGFVETGKKKDKILAVLFAFLCVLALLYWHFSPFLTS